MNDISSVIKSYDADANIDFPISLLDINQTQNTILSPVNLIFETVHPSDLENHCVISILNPYRTLHSSIPYNNARNPIHRNTLHKHNYFELLFVIDGEMYQNIEHKRHVYSKGSLCLLNRNVYHAEEFSTEFRCVFLALPIPLINDLANQADTFYFAWEGSYAGNLLNRFFNHNLSDSSTAVREYLDFIPCPDRPQVYQDMYIHFERLTRLFLNPKPGTTFFVKGILLQILSALLEEADYQSVPINIGTEVEARVFDSITQLMEQTNGRISRSELARRLNYEGHYLNNIAKKYSGLNLFNLGMTICMKKAKALLATPGMTVSKTAEELEFTNRTHFYNIFKQTYGMTPKEYQKSLSK